MKILERIFGKKDRYVLMCVADDGTEDEVTAYFKNFITQQQVRQWMRAGELEEGLYYLADTGIVDGSGHPKVLWRMREKKKVTADDVRKMEKEKQLKAIKDKTTELKAGITELEEIRDGFTKSFGELELSRGGSEVKVVIPDGIDTLRKGLELGFAHAAYKDIVSEKGMVTDVIKTLTGLGKAAGNYLQAAASEKRGINVPKDILKTTTQKKEDKIITKIEIDEKREVLNEDDGRDAFIAQDSISAIPDDEEP